eukprot:s100_g24.t1
MACATIGHTQVESAWCNSIVSNKAFDLGRGGTLSLPGFPNFKDTVDQLRNVTPAPEPTYSVCLAIGDSLVVRQCLVEQWEEKADFSGELKSLIKTHNAEFNVRGIKRGSEAAGGSAKERPTKRLCAQQDAMGLDEFETKFSERNDLASGHFTLSLTSDKVFLYSNEDYVVDEHVELCGFGSGDFAKQAEAADVMGDCAGRWALFDLSGNSAEQVVILEHSKKLPDHLRELDIYNKETGEVSTGIAEHQVTKTDGGDFTIKALEKVCFVLDPPKEKKKKKAGAGD